MIRLDVRARMWFLTWNNPVLVGPDKSIDILLAIGGLLRYCIQVEKGEEDGTVHLQGVMCFSSQKKWSTLRNHARIYWKKCRNVMAAKNYCSKKESRAGKQWVKGFHVQDAVVRDPLEGKTLYAWQSEILALVRTVPDDRSIYWYWSAAGAIGKTALAKHLALHYDAIVLGGKYKDAYFAIAERLDAKKDVDLCVFNLPRSVGNIVSYQALEGIKDGMFFSPKYKSNQCLYNPPHVIIFANCAPDLSKMSEDRWKIKCLDNNGMMRIGGYLVSS